MQGWASGMRVTPLPALPLTTARAGVATPATGAQDSAAGAGSVPVPRGGASAGAATEPGEDSAAAAGRSGAADQLHQPDCGQVSLGTWGAWPSYASYMRGSLGSDPMCQ